MIKKQLTKHNVEQWLQNALRDKNNTWKILLMQYQTNPEQLRLTLLAVMRAVFLFPAPEHYSSLPVFAADTTRDPHFFDTGTPGERLLTAFLAEHFPEEIPESGKNAEWHNRLYYRAGILKDDLSNDVLTYGIHASTENGPHPGIEGFLQMKEPMPPDTEHRKPPGKGLPAESGRNTCALVHQRAYFHQRSTGVCLRKPGSVFCSDPVNIRRSQQSAETVSPA